MDLDPDYNPNFKTKIDTKWVATLASIWIQCTSGSLYTFAIYSSVLKSSQGYDQSTLDTVSVFKDFGANVGVLSGLLYSATTSASGDGCWGGGPWVVLLAGAVQCFAGYFLMWLTVVGLLPRPHVLVMCLYMLLAAQATTFFNTANVVTGVHNFPRYRGTIVGIMKGFLGLSGAILIQVYRTIFKNKPTSYLLLLAVLPPSSALLLMWLVRICETTDEDEKKHLNGFSLVALILAAYLMAAIIVENIFSFNLSARFATFVLLILLLLSPIFVAIGAYKEKSYRIIKFLLEQNPVMDEQNRSHAHHTVNIGQDPTEYHQLPDSSDQVGDINERKTPQWGENLNPFQAMCTSGFWFLFFTTACGMGSGLTTVNNISQIGGSLGYGSVETDTLVSLWSIWNFLGRFGAGYVSDYFLQEFGWSRPLFIVITLAVMSIGYIVIASGLPGALYTGSVLVGICYGSQWSLMPTIVSEIFGVVHLGTIFNTITIAGPIASYILSVRVVGYFYDKEASGELNICTGTHCFMLSFFIMAATTFLGALVALALFFRTRNFYRNVRRLAHPN